MQEKVVRGTKTKKTRAKKTETIMTNSQPADSSGKVIFDEHTLCAQFIRDYVDLPYMKEVQPEDIEDVSPQFVPLVAEERNADRVKKINVKNKNPFYLISLIEHKTKPDYNIFMQIFRYMVYSPSQVVKVLADVLFAFLLKANVPVEEAEELVGKVKEKKMAELFADMEKMDIQAERRKTAVQRARAERAEAVIEEGIQLFVETGKKYSIPKEEILQGLVSRYGMSRQEAEVRVDRYW